MDQAELGVTKASSNIYSREAVWRLCERDWDRHGKIVPEAPRITLSAEEAVEELTKTLALGLRSTGHLAIKATAGLGKSTIAAKELVSLPDIGGKFVDIYAPSRKEQAQWQDRLQFAAKNVGASVSVLVIEGRNEENCIQHKASEILSAAGVSPTRMLCKTKDSECTGYRDCPYRAQFASKLPAIRIYNHSHLATPAPDGLPTPSIVVVDESFHQAVVDLKPIAASDLNVLHGVEFQRWAVLPKEGADTSNWSATASDVFSVCRLVREALLSERPLLDAIRSRGLSEEMLRGVARLIFGTLKEPKIGPNAATQKVEAEVRRCRRAQGTSVARLFAALATEIETGRSHSHAVRANSDGTFTLCVRKSLPRLCDVETVVILDADADENILRAVLPEVRLVSIEAGLNASITQIDDLTFSRKYLGLQDGATLNNDAVEALANRIKGLPGRRKLVVTYQKLIPALQDRLPPTAHPASLSSHVIRR